MSTTTEPNELLSKHWDWFVELLQEAAKHLCGTHIQLGFQMSIAQYKIVNTLPFFQRNLHSDGDFVSNPCRVPVLVNAHI